MPAILFPPYFHFRCVRPNAVLTPKVLHPSFLSAFGATLSQKRAFFGNKYAHVANL